MRISDWSSDVCSSDLFIPSSGSPPGGVSIGHAWTKCLRDYGPSPGECRWFAPERTATRGMLAHGLMVLDALGRMRPAVSRLTGSLLAPMDGEKGQPQEENADGTEVEDRGRDGSMDRSEEHTSELQSLMRNSDAAFCLKKKKKRL